MSGIEDRETARRRMPFWAELRWLIAAHLLNAAAFEMAADDGAVELY